MVKIELSDREAKTLADWLCFLTSNIQFFMISKTKAEEEKKTLTNIMKKLSEVL